MTKKPTKSTRPTSPPTPRAVIQRLAKRSPKADAKLIAFIAATVPAIDDYRKTGRASHAAYVKMEADPLHPPAPHNHRDQAQRRILDVLDRKHGRTVAFDTWNRAARAAWRRFKNIGGRRPQTMEGMAAKSAIGELMLTAETLNGSVAVEDLADWTAALFGDLARLAGKAVAP